VGSVGRRNPCVCDPRVVGLTLATARLLATWGAPCLFLFATLPRFLEDLIRNVLGDLPIVAPDERKVRDREILCRKRHTMSMRDGTLTDPAGAPLNHPQVTANRRTAIVVFCRRTIDCTAT
jgi:hypothetical protein